MSVAGNYFFSKDPAMDALYSDRCFSWLDPFGPNNLWAGKSSWYPSWNYPLTHDSALQIDSIKVWQYPDEDKDSTFTNTVQQSHSPKDGNNFFKN